MRIEFIKSRVDSSQTGFTISTIFSTIIRKKMPFAFYIGKADHLVTIIKRSSIVIDIKIYDFTTVKHAEIWARGYDDKIKNFIESIPTNVPVLYSLSDRRPITNSDFCMAVPFESDEIFFKSTLDTRLEGYDVFYFAGRQEFELEDIAVLRALTLWHSYGMHTIIPEHQTATAKALMSLLYYASNFGRDSARKLNKGKLIETCKLIKFESSENDYSMRVLANNGSRFKELIEDVCKGSDKVTGNSDSNDDETALPLFDTDSNSLESLMPFIRSGYISLTDIMYGWGVDFVVSALKKNEKLTVSVNMPDLFIRKMILTCHGVIIIRDGNQSLQFYSDLLGIEDSEVLISKEDVYEFPDNLKRRIE